MAQVSNAQSRTLRLLGSLSDDVKNTLQAIEGCVVLEKVSNDSPKTFVSAPDVSKVVEVLNTNNLLFRPHFYSLFVKFNTELKVSEVNKLNAQVLALVSGANVSYSRVDENGHTGKVVVDRFDDYNTLRASTGDVTFFKFNRTKAQARVNNSNTPVGKDNTDGWKTVNNTARVPRSPRTTGNVGDAGVRAPRTPRTAGDGSYQSRAPRTAGDGSYQSRAPRTTGDGSSQPRVHRSVDVGDRTPRVQRTGGQGGDRKSTNPRSWAGRTAASVASSAAPASTTPSSS
jgi:hypothetical protein